ncbi:MAG: hypothetical protein HC897_02150 [Thermoanaerobaculia bacterium]|nr:hypothetical protein [Thermoanaerobaculia bacterium]
MHPRLCASALLAVLLSASVPTLAAAQAAGEMTAEQIVDRCVEALGGQQAWDEVQTLAIKGTFATFSANPLPFLIERKRPNLYRYEFREAGLPVIVGFDGETTWWDNDTPFAEVDFPSLAPLAYSRGYQADAEFVSPLLDWRRRGHRIALEGKTSFEGADAWVIGVTLANGVVERWYVGVDDFLPVGRVSVGGFKNFEAESRSFFSDYRTVGGLLFPHHVESELDNRYGVMDVESVQLDPPLDDARFKLPLAPVMQRLQVLAGNFDVEVETRPLPALPWFPGKATATIRPLYGGRVLEEEISFLFAGQPRTIKRLYTFDRFRETLKVVRLDDLTAHPNVLESAAALEGRLELGNLGTGTSWSGPFGQTFNDRELLDEIGPDGFRLEIERSNDGGATWVGLARFRYIRRPDG